MTLKRTIFSIIPLPILLSLTSCVSVDSSWLRHEEGNQLEVTSGRKGSSRFVSVQNKTKTWNSTYQGGKEKIPSRKEFLIKIAEKEACRVCGSIDNVKRDLDPSFNMTDKSDSAFGGGLLGLALAHAFSSNENIPVSVHYDFQCVDEMGSKELSKK